MYKVEVSSKSGMVFEAQSKDYKFLIGIKGEGVTPVDTLLAALASCIGVYIRKYDEGSKLGIGEFSVSAQGELSKETPVCFRQISVAIDLKGFKLDERRQKALLEFIKNCPVHNTIENNPQVDFKIS